MEIITALAQKSFWRGLRRRARLEVNTAAPLHILETGRNRLGDSRQIWKAYYQNPCTFKEILECLQCKQKIAIKNERVRGKEKFAIMCQSLIKMFPDFYKNNNTINNELLLSFFLLLLKYCQNYSIQRN